MPQYRGSVDLSSLSSAPASPASGFVRLYGKSTDSRLYFVNSSGVDHQVGHPGEFTPQDHGMLTWAFPFEAATAGQAATGGTIYMIAQSVPRSATVTTIYWCNQSSGSSLNAAQCWAGLLDSSGAVLQSVDISSKGGSGNQSATITSQAVTPGLYWIALLFNGTNLPSVARGTTVNANSLNMNRTASTARYATNGTVQTTLTNRTPASNTVLASAIWVGMG